MTEKELIGELESSLRSARILIDSLLATYQSLEQKFEKDRNRRAAVIYLCQSIMDIQDASKRIDFAKIEMREFDRKRNSNGTH